MKKILLLSSFLSLYLHAQNLDILSKEKKQLRSLDKKIIKQDHEKSKNQWISPININSNINRSHSFSDESDKLNKTVSLGFTQSIYESGGIEFTIKYANEKLQSDFLNWQNENNQILQTVYETLLQIKKINKQLEQSDYELKNKEIELILKKIQYENGKSDIIELNNAIMAKNNQYKQNVNLKNSLKKQKLILEKYTKLKYQEIKLIDFSNINKSDYIKKNIQLLYEDSLSNLASTSYKKQKASYLPKVTLSTNLSYSENEDLISNNRDDNNSGSIGLSLSMPLYDINKKATLEKLRLESLKQKVNLIDLKNQIKKEFDETLTKIQTYKNYNKIINENIELYDDLIQINQVSSQAGMSSKYDLEILKNTKKINEYDLVINNIDMQLEYAKLYFQIKANN
ncbi:RND family efflux system, outer membrane channel protein, TolC family [Malaciobacter marinus]|uniref:RND family efflux system, outer membrane channel protein, TolC family n=1 Tax=Malaciobacter marinus TaxID=505249 RepID=A0A347TI70_9BACT|nr:TolC family protein [Malaciobacter marinus]AXX86298.1 RND family efflux system, outer membrane channel protein, TolC family [Malaciobacter marinus]PHO15687.1 transporter [Malaciobacter marinus]